MIAARPEPVLSRAYADSRCQAVMLNSATSASGARRAAGKRTRAPLARVSASSEAPPIIRHKERNAQGCTSCSASFIIGQLTPQVTVNATSSAMPERGNASTSAPERTSGRTARAADPSLPPELAMPRRRCRSSEHRDQKSEHRPPFSQSP